MKRVMSRRFAFVTMVLLLSSGQLYAQQPASTANSAPVIITTSLPDAQEADTWRTEIEVSDANEEDIIRFRLVEGPPGMGIDDDGELEWTPGYFDAGQHPVKLAVSDGKATVEKSFTLKVNNTNRLPEFADQDLPEARELRQFVFQLQASDADNEQVNFRLLEGPQGLELSASGEMLWAPSYSEAGRYRIEVAITDGIDEVKESWRLEVRNRNIPPQWREVFLLPATESEEYNAQLVAQDADGDSLRFEKITGPEKLRVYRDGEIRWEPSFSDAGEHELRVSVSDGTASVEKTFILNVVDNNRAPEMDEVRNLEAREGQAFTWQLQAKDADGDALVFSANGLPDGMQLQDDKLVWQPDYEQAGQYDFTVMVNDGLDTITRPFRIIVAPSNRQAEWLSLVLPAAIENTAYEFQLQAMDADLDQLRYKLESAPEEMTLSSSGLLQWKPSFEEEGSYPLIVSVSDGKSETLLETKLDVMQKNRAPGFTSKAQVALQEDTPWEYQVEYKDPDQDVLNLDILEGPPEMQVFNNRVFWTPDFNDAGSHDVLLVLQDLKGEHKATQSFTLNVANTNRKPVFENWHGEDLWVYENEQWSKTIHVEDPDNQPVKISLEKGMKGMVLQGNELVLETGFEDAGEYQLTLLASDGESEVRYPFSLVVENVNREPYFTSQPGKQSVEGDTYNYQIAIGDEDKTSLDTRLIEAPYGMRLQDGQLIWPVNYEQAGLHHVVVQIGDGEVYREQSFFVQVENTNRPPEFIKPPVTSVAENDMYSYVIDVVDPDKNDILISLQEAHEEIILEGHHLYWYPDFEDSGKYPVKLSVTDGEETIEQSFTLIVNNTNRLPVIHSEPVLYGFESVAWNYQVEATDADRQKLEYGFRVVPEGMVIDKTGKVSWLPNYNQQGDRKVVITVDDSEDVVEQAFVVKIENTNREPSIKDIPRQRITVGDRFKYQVEASDVDGSEIESQLVYGPEGMTMKRNVIYWKTDENSIGDHRVIVSATDGDLSVRKHFVITVLPNFD